MTTDRVSRQGQKQRGRTSMRAKVLIQQEEGQDSDKVGALPNLNLGQDFV